MLSFQLNLPPLRAAFAYADDVPILEAHAIGNPEALASITFLVAVNSTDKKCLAVAKSPYIEPDKTTTVSVGDCERVAFSYQLRTSTGNSYSYSN